MYTASEDDGQVEVCVSLVSYVENSSDETKVLVEVVNNTHPLNISADAATASKLDNNKHICWYNKCFPCTCATPLYSCRYTQFRRIL